MPAFELCTTYFPLVAVRYPPRATQSELDAYFRDMERVLARGRSGAVICLDNITELPTSTRRYVAANIDAITRRYPGAILGEAMYARSAWVRGLFTSYLWLRKNRVYPSRCFASYGEAVAWLRVIFAEAGEAVPTLPEVDTWF